MPGFFDGLRAQKGNGEWENETLSQSFVYFRGKNTKNKIKYMTDFNYKDAGFPTSFLLFNDGFSIISTQKFSRF